MRINYGQSVHNNEEIDAVVKVLRSSTQMGNYVKKFEKEISKIFSKKYGVMVNSGSSALFLAFKVLNLPKNSNVITPVLNFGTAISAILENNLIPNFVDVELDTYCIDANKIEKQINSKTKAMCIPNLIGNLPNWIKLRKIANKYNLLVIEDSADTIGAKYNSKSTGQYSDISISSFYGSHVINCAGNGGILCTSNKEWSNEAKVLRSWGRSSSLFKESENINKRLNYKIDEINYDAKFIFEKIGYNFEPSEISAAFGLVQIKKLRSFIKKRNKNFKKHYNFFNDYKNLFLNPRILKKSNTCFLAYPIQLNYNKIQRKKLQIFLEKNDIQTRVIFTGNILRQPGFKKIKYIGNKNNFKNADQIMRDGLLIGCHQGIGNEGIKYMHSKIKEFVSKQIWK